MRRSQFSIVLVCCLCLSLTLQAYFGGGLKNPSAEQVYEVISRHLDDSGFRFVGVSEFAGLPSLLAQSDRCSLYIVSIAHQGWNETTLKMSLQPDQKLSFYFNGEFMGTDQKRFYPTAAYYVSKLAFLLGLPSGGYPPMIAAVASGECDNAGRIWSKIPLVPYSRIDLASVAGAE